MNIQIEQVAGEDPLSRVAVQDNGCGIANFQALLTLGGSGWNKETKRTEDPAGMGFYSLCQSQVTVVSGARSAHLTPDVFLGKAAVEVMQNQEFVPGTRIEFTRPSRLHVLASCLERVAEFCPLAVHVNGKKLPRHDFLPAAFFASESTGSRLALRRNSSTAIGAIVRTGTSMACASEEHVTGSEVSWYTSQVVVSL